MTKFLLALWCIGAACVGVEAQSDIRKVDFKNFTFEPYCVTGEPQKITVTGGKFFQESGAVRDYKSLSFSVKVETYGDIDGDGKDEAFITSICNDGSGNYSEGFVYGIKDNQPILLTRIEGGAASLNGIREITVAGGIITVDRYEGCCMKIAVITRYKWNGMELVEHGKAESREISNRR